MIDLLLGFFSEFLIAALLVLSPSRLVRKFVYKIPLHSKPKSFTVRFIFIVIDCIVWCAIAIFAILLIC